MLSAAARSGPTRNGTRAVSGNANSTSSITTKKNDGERAGRNGSHLRKIRILVAVANRLLGEALGRMLTKRGGYEVLGFEEEILSGPRADKLQRSPDETVFLLASHGHLDDDVLLIRRVRSEAPEMKVILMGGTGEDEEFLKCVRAGVNGYLLRDASADDVLTGVRKVLSGEAVCPGACCATLFREVERDRGMLPSASLQRELGLTRREQQLIPLIARGLTNKEIANHFCLSEQTVKNHLYRMKMKIGADDRLGIVQVCHQQASEL